MSALDHCPGCGKRVTDYDSDGFEGDDAQRGHFSCGFEPVRHEIDEPLLVDARFAGGHIRVDVEPSPIDEQRMVAVALPGLTIHLFPHEAEALSAALSAKAVIATSATTNVA